MVLAIERSRAAPCTHGTAVSCFLLSSGMLKTDIFVVDWASSVGSYKYCYHCRRTTQSSPWRASVSLEASATRVHIAAHEFRRLRWTDLHCNSIAVLDPVVINGLCKFPETNYSNHIFSGCIVWLGIHTIEDDGVVFASQSCVHCWNSSSNGSGGRIGPRQHCRNSIWLQARSSRGTPVLASSWMTRD